MQPDQIRTVVDFRTFVRSLATTTAASYSGTLEAYLRALWRLIQQQRDVPFSYALFGRLLADAFTTAPLPFDEQWLAYQSPPEELSQHTEQIADDYAFVQEMILYQIADLHRMASAGTLTQPGHILWLGVESPTGHTWYNFQVASFLECASASLVDEDAAAGRDIQEGSSGLAVGNICSLTSFYRITTPCAKTTLCAICPKSRRNSFVLPDVE